jgi:DNA polymerase I-like protein with 3'-5' exonuclease and polymerase domains
LSQDRQLIQDIADEVDIHTKLYMSLHHTVPDKEQRRQFKRAAFAMLYGASAKRISEITGLDKDVAKRFIGAWGKRYPATVTYWNNHADRVKLCRVPSDRRSEDGRPLGISSVPAATGRILTYYEYANQWTGKASFSPTELRNYPIQSFATGDIVPALIARLFRALQSRELLKDRAVLVNTVHDSVELDVHKDSLKEVIELIRKVEHSIPRILKEDLNIDVKCQYRLGISYGPNWGEQTEVE